MTSTRSQPSLADYCLWVPDGGRQPYYGPAELVLVRPGGETLTFSCRAHREGWGTQIRGKYEVLEWADWVARGRGYRGLHLGG